MKHRYALPALLLAVLLLAGSARAQDVALHEQVAAAAAMATDIFAEVGGIEGGSQDEGHRGWIDVLSFSHGMSTSTTTTGPRGGGSGKASHAPVSFVKRLDKSTIPLVFALNTGRVIPEVTFEFVRRDVLPTGSLGSFVFFRVVLEGATVNYYNVGASEGVDAPYEDLGFVYRKVTYEYCEQRADGAGGPCSQTTYDVRSNVATNTAALTAPVAAVSGDAASFTWGMAEQDGVAGFELQRWEDGAFRRAAYVPGAGWTGEALEYSAAVSGLQKGVHLFRVAALGVDGRAAYSGEVRVALGVADGEGLVVGAPFPNPFASGTALPIASGTVQHARVTVLDVLGREVAVLFDGTVQPGGETLVPFAAGADLPSGLYVLRVVSEGGATSRTVTLRR